MSAQKHIDFVNSLVKIGHIDRQDSTKSRKDSGALQPDNMDEDTPDRFIETINDLGIVNKDLLFLGTIIKFVRSFNSFQVGISNKFNELSICLFSVCNRSRNFFVSCDRWRMSNCLRQKKRRNGSHRLMTRITTSTTTSFSQTSPSIVAITRKKYFKKNI